VIAGSLFDGVGDAAEKAIYLHEARQYQVEKFGITTPEGLRAARDSDYFTDAIDYTQVKNWSSSIRGR